MHNKRSLRQVVVAIMLFAAFLVQGTWALAGTTGGLSGQVTGAKGAPIAGAVVMVTSPSQTASETTDASGHFSFLSLAPDSYTVTASKAGYNTTSYPGVTVFADQSLTLTISLQTALKTIAKVTARSAGSLVKPGTTADVYSVNAATQTAVSSIGGGYNLDSAYSAIYSQPGVTSQIGNYGFGQVYYIRGSSYSQVGYEYDGVPVNRAFDNYNANSLSNLGAQETEVYTGGSPAGGSSATLAGYINQVIKTGTFPGYANVNAGVGYPAFYHKFGVEAGGSTPDRMFSYYVGLQGANQTYNTLDNTNGAGQPINGTGPNGIYSSIFNPLSDLFANYTNGTWATCPANGSASKGVTFQGLPTCNIYTPWSGSGFLGLPLITQDRENVMNFHFGIQHRHDAGRDDVQALFYNFAYHQIFGGSIQDSGGLNYINTAFGGWGGPSGIAALLGIKNYPGEGGPYSNLCAYQGTLSAFGIGPGCATTGGSTLAYADGFIFAPGTTFGQDASTAHAIVYSAPSQPAHTLYAGVPVNSRDTTWNDGTVIKLQYQKNIGSSAYLRLMGYTFYSDWLMSGPQDGNAAITGYGYGTAGFDYPSPDYELNTHTRGLQLQFADQINAENLLQFTGNYTTASVVRWNNEYYAAPSQVTSLVDSAGNCYNTTTGDASNCLLSGTGGTYANPTGTTPIVGAAAAAGAKYVVTVPQGYGPVNNVVPKFSVLALTDEFRPTDRWDLNLGVRYEDYEYDLGNTVNPEFNFWFHQAQAAYCYDPSTGAPVLTPVTPTTPPNAQGPIIDPNDQYGVLGLNPGLCYTTNGAGSVVPYVAPSGQQARHPNGYNGNLLYSNVGPSTFVHPLWSPRIGGTFTVDPDTVLRFSYGRYTQPTETAFEQYSNASGYGAAKFGFGNFFGLGFDNLTHNNQVQTSNNSDLSFEHHFKNSDWSLKLSPFFRWTTNQLVTVSLGGNFASGINAATQQTYGVELSIQKGDPSRNGLSGQLNYTYTNARIKYYTLSNGSNTIDTINNYIQAFNKLTSSGGGSPYYCGGTTGGPNGSNTPASSPGACTGKGVYAIANPYYNDSTQGTLDPNGWSSPYANNPPYSAPDFVTSSAISPNVFAGFLNYKRNRFTATLTGQLNQGTSYGSPLTIIGLDPRNCSINEAGSGRVAPGSAQQYAADYQYCGHSEFTPSGNLAIPDPQNGNRFDGLGQFTEPWQINLGLQFGYDITPKIHATLVLANIVNTCFGGSTTAWSSTYKPNSIVCAYAPQGGNYVGAQPGAGFFYGSSPTAAVNGTYPNVFNQAYQPLYGALPFQVYGQVQVRM